MTVALVVAAGFVTGAPLVAAGFVMGEVLVVTGFDVTIAFLTVEILVAVALDCSISESLPNSSTTTPSLETIKITHKYKFCNQKSE